MDSVLAPIVIGVAINCEQLHIDTLEKKGVNWSQVVCEALAEEYENVTIVPLIITKKKNLELSNSLGLSVSPPKAGRVSVSWIETSEIRNNKVTVELSFEAYDKVWTFKHSKNQGSKIDGGDVITKKINVAPFIGVKKIITDSPVGKRMIKHCDAGQVVFEEYLGAPIIAKKNDRITGVVIANGVRVEMSVQILEDIYQINQKFKMRTLPSGAVLYGVYDGNGIAYVEE
jgi:flagella basal body P-ring formation protein FlgA